MMYSRGHPGKTGIGKCTLVVAEPETASTASEAPLSPELRVAEKRNVVTSLADNLKAVSINKEGNEASSEGKDFYAYQCDMC